MNVRVGPWDVDADPETTASVHERIALGGPESCGCRECRNFAAARDVAYPQQAQELFRRLGIRCDRETELCAPVPLEGGRWQYSGWFHFVGRILEGPSGEVERTGSGVPGTVSELTFHALSEGFGVLLRPKRDLLPDAFGSLPVVQFEFTTEVPWLLPEDPEAVEE